jgi:hypothetical protein
MKTKLRLNLDELHVDAFDTAAAPERRGTVQAHDQTPGTDCNITWGDNDTCFGPSCRRGTACNVCPI